MSRASVTTEQIDLTRVAAAVASPANGATVLFAGTVREVSGGRAVEGLEYSAYESMAVEELQRILEEAESRYPGTTVIATHRVGALSPGDVSIAIAAAHPHRASAFDAARYVIEETKHRLPIWKREQYVDGAREWVAPAIPAGGV